MRKKLSFFFALCILLSCVVPIAGAVATNDSPSRVINLVYDDSGSMIETDILDANGEVLEKDALVDTWCKAKYATEVFAALLGEKDTLNIFVMSDYSKAKLKLNGKDGAETNVKKVHSMITNALSTPFDSVRSAYNDLITKNADEKWLVVLTDGDFSGIDDIDAYFATKQNDIKVMFLAMGPMADGITEDINNNIFYKEAKTSDAILEEITDISKQIFNRDRLNFDTTSKTLPFDVPMRELIVFAQGADVKINGIQSADGKVYTSTSAPVTVRYSEKGANNYDDFVVDKNLVGSIATFRGDFPIGTYTIDVSGAQTIEVYYKPNVEIAAFLKDINGNEVTDLENLEAGEYIIDFGLVKSGTDESIGKSELLGNVSFEAIVTNNGSTHEQIYRSGDRIQLAEGDLSIRATARYLEYNTVSTALDYTVFQNKELAFTVIDGPVYNILENGFEDIPPTKVKVTVDGRNVTAEEWEEMQLPSVSKTSSGYQKLNDFTVEKSEDVGIFNVYPMLNSKPNSAVYTDCEIQLFYEATHGIETWYASCTVPICITDSRTWIERNRDLFIKLLIAAVIIVYFFGFIPGVKKYIPRTMKSNPKIAARPAIGNTQSARTYSGSLQKNIPTTIFPYFRQKATLTYAPSTARGAKTLELRAKNKNTMTVINAKAFINNTNFTINGQTPHDTNHKLHIYPTSVIIYKTQDWTYTCNPNLANN